MAVDKEQTGETHRKGRERHTYPREMRMRDKGARGDDFVEQARYH